MANLYILGAGCSRNYSQSTHGIQGLECPLDSDFFTMARLVIENSGMKSDELFMEEIDAMVKTIAPLYGGKIGLNFFDDEAPRLEDAMTLLDIDSRLFSSPPSQKDGQNESRQMRALKDLLARTLDYALMGPACTKHRLLAKKMRRGDVVLSLNYDILIDNALYNLGKATDSSYGMNFYQVNQDGQWVGPISEQSEVSLLKLHGSLNWVRCGLCGSLLLYRHRKQVLSAVEPFKCPRCSSVTGAERVMIPPVQSKDYRDKDIAFLWVQADRMMKEFSRIICIGYSFSPLDFDMSSLMRRFRTRQTRSPEVDFVNPDGSAEDRLEHLLGIQGTNRFKNLSEYLESA